MDTLPLVKGHILRRESNSEIYVRYFCEVTKGFLIGYKDFFNREIIFSFCINFAKIIVTDADEKPRKWRMVIYLGREAEYIEMESKEDFDHWMKVLKRICFMTNFSSCYEVLEDMSPLSTKSNIHLLKSKINGDNFVGKKYSKIETAEGLWNKDIVRNEIKVMVTLDSERFLRLIEFFDEPDYYMIVIEYARGGTLLDEILSKKSIPIEQTAVLIKNLATSLHEMHSQGILHRDIKLENIFISSKSDYLAVKLGDFDISCFKNSNNDFIICGTPGYVAPEVFELKEYTEKSDIFSLGIVLFALIFKKFPFGLDEAKSLFEAGKQCPIVVPDRKLEAHSPELAALVHAMLNPNPDRRPSAEDILNSEWIKIYTTSILQRAFESSEFRDDEDEYVKLKNHIFKEFECEKTNSRPKLSVDPSKMHNSNYPTFSPAYTISREAIDLYPVKYQDDCNLTKISRLEKSTPQLTEGTLNRFD